MSEIDQLGESNGGIDTWSNSIPYLQRIAELENKLQYFYLQEDVPACLKIIDTLMIQLKRNTRKEKKLFEIWNKLERLLGEAEDLVYKTKKIQGNGQIQINQKNMLMREAYLKARECWIIIGDIQFELGLVFKKGIEPNDAWALG